MTPDSDIIQLTLRELAERLSAGTLDAETVTAAYLRRIESVNAQVNAVIEVNPDALTLAQTLDQERSQGTLRGRLHGIPILLKDNIDTGDRMCTTAGSLALDGSVAPEDAYVVKRLRRAGALILGKTNLSEWANMRSSRSSTGWSSRGGQTRNPFDLNRSPGGSSAGSGAAVAAGMCAAAIGTETDGSVVIPASMNSLVGIKPSIGLVGRTGIIPIAASQDTAGPMARTVEDAAMLLTAMLGSDPEDAYAREPGTLAGQLTDLDPAALRGARIGVARAYCGRHEGVTALLERALDSLRECGASVVDEVDLDGPEAFDEAERVVLCHELKAGLKAYLQRLGPDAPMQSLGDLIRFNEMNAERVMPYFQQEHFLVAEATHSLEDPVYVTALAENRARAGADGIDAALARHRLDALVAPTIGPAWSIDLVNGDHRSLCCSTPAAIAGYAHVSVPAGHVHGLPVGLSFFAGDLADAKVVRFAYAFEQQTHQRLVPRLSD